MNTKVSRSNSTNPAMAWKNSKPDSERETEGVSTRFVTSFLDSLLIEDFFDIDGPVMWRKSSVTSATLQASPIHIPLLEEIVTRTSSTSRTSGGKSLPIDIPRPRKSNDYEMSKSPQTSTSSITGFSFWQMTDKRPQSNSSDCEVEEFFFGECDVEEVTESFEALGLTDSILCDYSEDSSQSSESSLFSGIHHDGFRVDRWINPVLYQSIFSQKNELEDDTLY